MMIIILYCHHIWSSCTMIIYDEPASQGRTGGRKAWGLTFAIKNQEVLRSLGGRLPAQGMILGQQVYRKWVSLRQCACCPGARSHPVVSQLYRWWYNLGARPGNLFRVYRDFVLLRISRYRKSYVSFAPVHTASDTCLYRYMYIHARPVRHFCMA